MGNTDGAIGSPTISDPPTQAEVQALRDACEELADDVRALSALVHALRGALVAVGVVKGGAQVIRMAFSNLPRHAARQLGLLGGPYVSRLMMR